MTGSESVTPAAGTIHRAKGIKLKRKREKERIKRARYYDYSLLFFLIVLLGVGFVMLYSTSAPNATLRYGNSMYFLKKQIVASVLGFVALLVCSFIDYHFFEKIAGLLYVLSLGLCVYVIFGGTEINNSSRWIYIHGVSFQPSELAKVGLVLALAKVISMTSKSLWNQVNVLKLFLFILPLAGVVAVNNLSTAIVIFGIGTVMIFVAAPKNWIFVLVVALGAAGIAVMMMIPSLRYRSERIQIWLNPEGYEKGYQTLQGLYAIGSGGLFGKGLGESVQKVGPVPEAQNDMIFSIICEELGLFGAVCIIILYILLLWRCLFIALNARDMFGSYVVIGIMAHIAIHVILNIAVVTNTMPNTGVTLPFISYGGTSIAILIGEMGIVLSVSRGIHTEL